MTCWDMDDVISSQSGDLGLEPKTVHHLIHCQRCRGLTLLMDNIDEGVRPSESQLRRIQAGILRDLKPIRPLAPSRILLLGCAIIFLTVVAVGVLLLGTNGWGALTVLQRVAVFLTLAVSAILLSVSMVQQIVPGSKNTFAPAFLFVAIPVALMMAIAATFRSQQQTAFVVTGLICMKNGLAFSLPAAFLLGLILRRGAILFPKFLGAVAGGLAGLIGISVLEINCPNLNVFHILVWHGGVILTSSLGGLLLGTVVESIERRRRHFEAFGPAR